MLSKALEYAYPDVAVNVATFFLYTTLPTLRHGGKVVSATPCLFNSP